MVNFELFQKQKWLNRSTEQFVTRDRKCFLRGVGKNRKILAKLQFSTEKSALRNLSKEISCKLVGNVIPLRKLEETRIVKKTLGTPQK